MKEFTFHTKESNKIWKLDSFCLLETNWASFFGLIWKAGFSFSPNFPWPFSVTTQNSCEGFWLKEFTFQTKESNNIRSLDPFRPLQTNWLFFWADLESRMQDSVLAQTFHRPSVSQNKSTVKVFDWRNLPFRQKRAITFEILTLSAHSKQID